MHNGGQWQETMHFEAATSSRGGEFWRWGANGNSTVMSPRLKNPAHGHVQERQLPYPTRTLDRKPGGYFLTQTSIALPLKWR